MMYKKIFTVLLVLAMSVTLTISGTVSAGGVENPEEQIASFVDGKIYDNATLEDDFEEDCVLVLLTNEASLALQQRNASSFAEIGCTAVEDLAPTRTARVAETLSKQADVMQCDSGNGNKLDGDPESYYQFLKLTLTAPGKQNVLDAIKLLMQREDVFYAFPNYIFKLEETTNELTEETMSLRYGSPALRATTTVTPNDSYYADQLYLDAVSVPEAWEYTTGSTCRVTVGIIDGGIQASHPDLVGKVSVSKSKHIDEEGRVTQPTSVSDSYGHGTMIAGIIGAQSNNTTGITGINWNAELVSLKACYGEDINVISIARAINVAEEMNIPILNISLGSNPAGTVHGNLVAAVEGYSGLIVTSAGNEGVNIDLVDIQLPACLDDDNIIVVGATMLVNLPWQGSNYGQETVDLFAPGVSILSTYPTDKCGSCTAGEYPHYANGYHYDSGTSFATPIVAGVASLLLSRDNTMSTQQLVYHLKAGVDTYDAFEDKCSTGGVLNAFKTVIGHSVNGMVISSDAGGHVFGCACDAEYEPHSFVDVGGLWVCSVCQYTTY